MSSSSSKTAFRGVAAGLLASLSIAAGYFPIAFSFGLAALQAGLSPTTAILTSVVVYAGASQFILITLLGAGAGALTAVPTIILMNTRHLFYGPALQARLSAGESSGASATHHRLPSALLAWGLTDEVFATALGRFAHIPPAIRETWYLGLQLGAYAAWVGGTILGVSLSHSFQNPPVFVEAALSFILPGLFFALLLESGLGRSWRTVAAAGVFTTLCLIWLPGYQALVLGMLAGALFNAIRHA